MKFLSVYLQNYIGIYNGLGIYEMFIDMTKCKNRITIIRGDNGSGKSTLMKAMTVFPDPNEQFIPGMPARKEIVLQDGPTVYILTFIHGIKQNGERETTKAYIRKTFNGATVELNENGNVSSYKDILYSELGLDANFLALSQLSTEDRGLADKKPAERKKFVNSIISSLETYNNIYKTLTKRASNFKSMINALVAKLNILGDEQALTSGLDALESRINRLNDQKDQMVVELAKEQSTIELLDPDGSIQSSAANMNARLQVSSRERFKISKSIEDCAYENGIQLKSIELMRKEYDKLKDERNDVIISNTVNRNNIDMLMKQQQAEAESISAKCAKLAQLQDGGKFDELCDKVAIYEAELAEIESEIRKHGITDPSSISKEEYILALETLRELEESISTFKASSDYSNIQNVLSYYINSGEIMPRINIKDYTDGIEKLEKDLANFRERKASIDSRIHLLNTLALRPESCTDDTCGFIKDAVEFAKQNPKEESEKLDQSIIHCIEVIRDMEQKLSEVENFNNTVNQFSIIAREVKKNAAILAKLPNGEMFADVNIFFERLMNGYSFEYMKEVYSNIHIANSFDIYRQTAALLAEYRSELKVFEGRIHTIDQINEDIDRLNKRIDEIRSKIDPIKIDIENKDLYQANLTKLINAYEAIFSMHERLIPIDAEIDECNKGIADIQSKMEAIRVAVENSNKLKASINSLTLQISPLMADRDKMIHSVQMMKDYKAEKEELENNFKFIETIKYYSSPTTGIQLVFMELYMGQIISLANELLSLLFKGQYVIKPFVINESEFRIPCLGSGYINDDISSMSSSQIGMISMILSFALLHQSSTKYNIIKLDEIDGPLDYNNRVFFIDVLNQIMDIMGTEQCIMISHNSELQVDNSDVILLKHDTDNNDYYRGNIIWRY